MVTRARCRILDANLRDGAPSNGSHQNTTTMKFIVKNCAAQEPHLETSSSMETLGDLRAAIWNGWGLPPFMQRIVIGGRTCSDQPDRELLATIFARHPAEPDRECVVWVPWLAEDDCIDMEMGWTFHKDELKSCRARASLRSRPFEPVTLRACLGRIVGMSLRTKGAFAKRMS